MLLDAIDRPSICESYNNPWSNAFMGSGIDSTLSMEDILNDRSRLISNEYPSLVGIVIENDVVVLLVCKMLNTFILLFEPWCCNSLHEADHEKV